MKEQFIPYELALKLKELGFNEECLSRYIIITKWEEPTGEIKLQMSLDANIEDKNLIKAPLWQQCFYWFREKHNYIGTIYANASGYCFEIHDSAPKGGSHRYDSGFTGPNDSGCWNKYEEARQACLEKLIELCKKN